MQILGRWICGVVLHYCRLAPLKTIADYFKRGSSARTESKTIARLAKKTKKLSDTLEHVTTAYEEHISEIRKLVVVAEANSRPREYVANRKFWQGTSCIDLLHRRWRRGFSVVRPQVRKVIRQALLFLGRG